MAINFGKLLTPEAKLQFDAEQQRYEVRTKQAAEMDVDQLVNHVLYSLQNCVSLSKFRKGQPVYEANLVHVLIPELLKRVQGK